VPSPNNLAAIRRALESAGVEFTNRDAPGVRLSLRPWETKRKIGLPVNQAETSRRNTFPNDLFPPPAKKLSNAVREGRLSEAAASASAGARFLVERNHDVGGLNDGCRRHPDLELEFVDRLVRDRGRDDLTAAQFEAHVGGGRTLGYLDNLTGQLVPCAYFHRESSDDLAIGQHRFLQSEWRLYHAYASISRGRKPLHHTAMTSDETLKHTPLHALHVELGARMVPFAGYEMPVQYPLGRAQGASSYAHGRRSVRCLAHGADRRAHEIKRRSRGSSGAGAARSGRYPRSSPGAVALCLHERARWHSDGRKLRGFSAARRQCRLQGSMEGG